MAIVQNNILSQISLSKTFNLLFLKSSLLKKNSTIVYNMKGCLKAFYFYILNILNIFTDDYHFSNITKLKKNTALITTDQLYNTVRILC
jgi:hypothetical protein